MTIIKSGSKYLQGDALWRITPPDLHMITEPI
jgi:hypothetical protein